MRVDGQHMSEHQQAYCWAICLEIVEFANSVPLYRKAFFLILLFLNRGSRKNHRYSIVRLLRKFILAQSWHFDS